MHTVEDFRFCVHSEMIHLTFKRQVFRVQVELEMEASTCRWSGVGRKCRMWSTQKMDGEGQGMEYGV